MIKIEKIIEITLVGIYSHDILNEKLYLKGGQALRFAQDLKTRFSRDIDFSLDENLEKDDIFFTYLRDSLTKEFYGHNFHLFDFNPIRRPNIKNEGTPDFWGGWKIEFKIIENEKRNLKIEDKRRQAIIPEGVETPKIEIDISEYEYCGSAEKIKLNSVLVKTYSRVLLILEKIRAICQQHSDYELRINPTNRARDYYDIERLYYKIIEEGKKEEFLNEAEKHLEKVFSSKKVPLSLLDKIFQPSFFDLQSRGWESVKGTVLDKIQEFEYYNETIKDLIKELKLRIGKGNLE